MKTDEKVYNKTLKPLIQRRKFGLLSNLIKDKPELKAYMTRGETMDMMNYYEKTLYTLSSGLEDLMNNSIGTDLGKILKLFDAKK